MIGLETENLPFELAVGFGNTYRQGDELGREFTATLSVGKELIGLSGRLALLRAGVRPRNEMAVILDDSLDVRKEIGNSTMGTDILKSDEMSSQKIVEILSSGRAV